MKELQNRIQQMLREKKTHSRAVALITALSLLMMIVVPDLSVIPGVAATGDSYNVEFISPAIETIPEGAISFGNNVTDISLAGKQTSSSGENTKTYDTQEDVLEASIQIAYTFLQNPGITKEKPYMSGTFHAAASESPAYIDGLNDGYYAVFDTTKATNDDNPAQGAYTLGLLKVSNGENVNVTTKVSLPTFEKNILDVNDSSSALTKAATGVAAYDTTTNTWAKDADHDKGDNVPFQLVATIPSNYAEYKEYWLKMHDNLQADVFTLNDDFVVYYVHGGTKTAIPDTAYTTITTNLTTNENFAGFTEDTTEDFTIEFANLKSSVPAIEAGDQIVVEYSALLTEDANVGSAGNWNGAYLEYVNNPNWDGTGTPDTGDKEKTPEDTVVAFTYQTDFTKLDAATSQPLSGAVFALYKEYATAPTGGTACTETGYTNYYKVGGNQTSAASTGSFGWSGLDDGDYVLVEITPPTDANGVAYNAISPIPFTITAEHGNKALTSLNDVTLASTGNDTHINLNSGFVPIANDTTKNAVVSYADGSIEASIANSKETTLPSTGGMGTILFYTVGGIMVIGAGVVLVTKKRSKNEQ